MSRTRKPLFAQSLLEAMIAVVVLSIAITSLWNFIVSSLRLMDAARNRQLAEEVVDNVLAYLRAHPDFGEIYQRFGVYNGVGEKGKFYIRSDLSISWDSRPQNAVGEGFFEFVTHEYRYFPEVWGTETAFEVDGRILVGKFDLNGNGTVENRGFLIGQTEDTPWDAEDCYRILPVRVIVKIYGNYEDVSAEGKEFLRP